MLHFKSSVWEPQQERLNLFGATDTEDGGTPCAPPSAGCLPIFTTQGMFLGNPCSTVPNVTSSDLNGLVYDNPQAAAASMQNHAVEPQVQCLRQAVGKNSVSLTLDVAGFIPGEGVGKAVTQLGVGLAGVANSAIQQSGSGIFLGIAGIHLTALEAFAKEAGWSLAKAVPIFGTGLNVGATLYDLNNVGKDYQACMNGH